MSVLIVGAKGNMGRRYAAVLEYLGVAHRGIDADWTHESLAKAVARSKCAIIATPTDTHIPWIRLLAPYGMPILCEKPISPEIGPLKLALKYVDEHGAKLNMVYQYRELAEDGASGESLYDYWNHGRDGLVWDCIQILGLSKGKVTLGERSPIWKCKINGKSLRIGDMDLAYIKHIRRWLQSPGQSTMEILDIHEKTAEYAKKWAI